MKYLALLRGINVGGNNIIKMTDLKLCFEQSGYDNVLTYIQSGNVLFTTPRTNIVELENTIEAMLKRRFGYSGVVVIMSTSELATIVREAPSGFGDNVDMFRYDVYFLKRPLAPQAAAANFPLHPEVDTLYVGTKALYTSRLIARSGSSKLSKIIALPQYKHITIRNWNTTTTLATLANAALK